jgi:hypothetical protein
MSTFQAVFLNEVIYVTNGRFKEIRESELYYTPNIDIGSLSIDLRLEHMPSDSIDRTT